MKSAIQKYDSGNMHKLIREFPNQVQAALTIAQDNRIPKPQLKIDNVLIIGMGGSAIGGDILKDLISASGTFPCSVIRGYEVPGWVSDRSFTLVSSYSGNTEETLAAYQEAISKGCQCLVSTSGGKLQNLANENKHRIIQIPGGQPPRTALGYLFIPFLMNLVDWGWIDSRFIDMNEVIELLSSMSERYDPGSEVDSKALEIAEFCKGRIPVIYSSSKMETVAIRWKGQISENSKVLAYNNVIPEMNHNEIIGWQRAGKMGLNKQLAAILIRDHEDHPRVQKRMNIVKELINRSETPLLELETSGNTLLARMFSLIYLADFVSFNLAMLNEEDPTPILNIEFLKSKLAEE